MADKLRTLYLRSHKGSPFVCQLLVKVHEPTKGEPETGPAIFASGFPLGFDEESVRSTFECFGAVAQTVLHKTKVGPGIEARSETGCGSWDRQESENAGMFQGGL